MDPYHRGDKEPTPPSLSPSPGKGESACPGGMLVQTDGSFHRWLGDEHPQLTLHLAVDATIGKVLAACFRRDEDAADTFNYSAI